MEPHSNKKNERRSVRNNHIKPDKKFDLGSNGRISKPKVSHEQFRQEITKRKRAEETLRESEGTVRALLNATNDSVFLIDTEGTVLALNEITARRLGKKVDEMLGGCLYDFLPPELAKRRKTYLDEVIRAGKPIYFEEERQGIWLDTYAHPILDANGKVAKLAIYARDITERKHAEEALRESEERYRTLVETSPDAITLLDLNLDIVMANRPALALYGYENPEEVIGQSASDFIDPEDRPRAVEDVRKMFETGSTGTIEYTLLRKGDVPFPAEVRTSFILDSEKRPLAIICVTRDISGRKRAEEEKATLQEQLRQSQKMEAIGRLAGGIAHDFNNLLTVIKGYCQLSLVQMKEGNPLREAFEVIDKTTEKAADLTRQLLAFSRRQIMEMRVLDLSSLLQNLNKMLRRIIGEDIELVMLLEKDLGRAKTDPGQIEQVVMNLAVNAKDAMPKGGKLIIETANVELDEAYAHGHVAVTPGRYVMITVSDTGVGMAPEVRDQVFEPFFTTKEKGKGTGLGLSTVYGIVKQSSGNIWVYSEPGKGTTFKIYLPRVDEPAEELKEKVVGEEFPCGSETIVIVEDDEEVRKMVVRILKKQGYTVLEGGDGDEAYDASKQHKGPIHLLVTDVVLPGMDGHELAKRLEVFHPKLKVLYMSGYTENAIVHRGVLEEGMNYIQKPFTVSGLVRKAREVLDQ
jgi:two-component system cell cycle sensor histidine kinase/response regulator CckA